MPSPTLAIFLQTLEGSRIIVETQKDTIVKGILETVDRGMNVMMKDVSIKDVYGRCRESSSLHMRSSAIRCVHLPPNINPSAAVRTRRKRLAVAKRENYTAQQQRPSLPKGGG